jgi:hypothetical protein
MVVERLLTNTANLESINSSSPIGGTARQLGFNFKTSAAGKKVVAAYVKMNAAGAFAAGTRWQLWKRATPISASTLVQNIDIGGLAGTPGLEVAVPGVAQTALVQNDFYMTTIFHPSTDPGSYWFKGGFGNPVNGSLSGNCIFKDTGATSATPPDDESFVGGGFAVDIAIDDATTDITATLAIVLPPVDVDLVGDADVNATLNIVLPPVDVDLVGDAPGVPTADGLFAPIAQRLLDCWQTQLLTLPVAQRPQRIGFRFDAGSPTMGIAMLEDECKCGSAWVRVVDWYITSDATFPGADTSFEGQLCPTQYGLVLEFGIGRCPPGGDEKSLETVQQRNDFHLTILGDMKLMRKTLFCCFGNVPQPEDMIVGDWQKIGPEGKCFQQALTITVRVVNCDEC